MVICLDESSGPRSLEFARTFPRLLAIWLADCEYPVPNISASMAIRTQPWYDIPRGFLESTSLSPCVGSGSEGRSARERARFTEKRKSDTDSIAGQQRSRPTSEFTEELT